MKAMTEKAFDDYIADYPHEHGDTLDVDIDRINSMSGLERRVANITVNGRFVESIELVHVDGQEQAAARVFQPHTKKPITIEAVRWDGTLDHAEEIIRTITAEGGEATWVNQHFIDGEPKPEAIVITTLEGDMDCTAGNWVIKGVKGEFYPCRDDIFRQNHEGF